MTNPDDHDSGLARSRRLLLGGVGVLGVGVALAIAGVVFPALFVPGTWVIGLGLLVLVGAGVLGIIEARDDS